MRQKLLLDIGGTLSYKFYLDSIQQIPSSAKITILDDGGTEEVAQVAVTNIEPDGTMKYTVTSAIADDVAYNWQAKWEFVVSGTTYYRTALFYIVRHILENPVVDKDIINAAPFLKDKNYSQIITASGGSKTTIISSELQDPDDYWNGGSAEVIDGTNFGEIRKITDFVNSSNTLTTEEFTAIIDVTSKVTVIRTFKKEIDRAFDKFELDMKNRGIYIDWIIDNDQVKEYIIVKSLQLICEIFATDITDIWIEKAKSYKDEYKKLLGVAVFDYDSDDDGNVEDDEAKNSLLQSQGVR